MYACLLSECIIAKFPGLAGTENLALCPGCVPVWLMLQYCPGIQLDRTNGGAAQA